jgi:hypothetical protein
MAPRATFAGVVKNGVFFADDGSRWFGALRALSGKRVSIEIGKERVIKSMSMERYLHAVVYRTIADATGNDQDDVHEGYKRKFLSWQNRSTTLPSGDVVPLPPTTRTLSNDEFRTYLDQVIADASTMGIEIPAANQVREN